MAASPNTVMQSLLDQALKLADPDARARFWLILRGQVNGADEPAPDTASTVTMLRTATSHGGATPAMPTPRGQGMSVRASRGQGRIKQERPA